MQPAFLTLNIYVADIKLQMNKGKVKAVKFKRGGLYETG